MSAIAINHSLDAFGICEIRPIRNLPDGVLNVRVRLRDNDFPYVFLKFADRVERWGVNSDGEYWELLDQQGANVTVRGRNQHLTILNDA